TNHVKELTSKQYQRYVKDAADFVMMFVPNEGAYMAAMNADTVSSSFKFCAPGIPPGSTTASRVSSSFSGANAFVVVSASTTTF
ncbi:MAG: DNA recombination protein RmuC, partial [Clostridia bacterium]|nr:DNA recombination protein RmuC [Clostridia bacterium]